ncbi:MAG TPA: hypothetical protein VH518_06455 [Tepidisphaeraceae bacterium]|jgi:hypothetical protein
MILIPLLAEYRPFLDPLPIYRYWFWLLLPLCLLFSIVYKSAKVQYVRQIPRAALAITFWILLGMAAASVVLTVIVKIQEH